MILKNGDRVRKKSGSEWQGRVVGQYSTALTPEGYAVESETHRCSVQIYPAKALELVDMAHSALQEAIAELEAELVEESARTAEQKLRADQISKQHDMQCAMHKEAVDRAMRAESQLEAIGAGGVEPLRKGFVRLTDVLARLEQGFGANSAPATTIKRHFEMQAAPAHPAEGVPAQRLSQATIDFLKETLKDCDDSARDAAIGHDIEKMLRTATHPTQQGLEQDAARYQALVESGNFAPSPFDNGMWGLRASSIPSTKAELDAAVDRVIAAQAKQGGAA